MKLANLLINKRLFYLTTDSETVAKYMNERENFSNGSCGAGHFKKTGLDVVEAAQLAHELLQASKGRGSRWKRARECIRLGEEALVARGKR